ncbi:MAG TPA: hypothetical protein VLI39_15965 [Sedimentisphaerales bacterium]|nr:hypothetical protein [Sedimentisphaerales bacterium]
MSERRLEDEWLKWKLRRGSPEALARVDERYIDAMLTLAASQINRVRDRRRRPAFPRIVFGPTS